MFRKKIVLSQALLDSVRSYVDENYVGEAGSGGAFGSISHFFAASSAALGNAKEAPCEECSENILPRETQICMPSAAPLPFAEKKSLQELLQETDAGFSETLLKIIDASGKKDSEIYKKANVDRKLFSKIRSNPEYRPSKTTALAFAIALELDLEGTKDLLERAGYALSHSSKGDIIVEYFIVNGMYDLLEINAVLFEFDQKLLGT